MSNLNITLVKNNIEKAALYDFDNNKVFGSAYCAIQGNDVIHKNVSEPFLQIIQFLLPKTQYSVWLP